MTSSGIEREADLTGQVAIVTGGGRGIGRAIVLALTQSGANVAVVARSEDQLAETVALTKGRSGRAFAFPADVTDAGAVEGTVAQVERRLGPVDLLVNNAGHGGEVGATWEVDPDEWWRCMDVNLRGPFLCTRSVLPSMIARRRGRIVTTASHTGLILWPGSGPYAISKTAVIRFCENLATEVKEYDISVFAIHPGGVETALTASQFKSEAARRWFPQIYEHVARGGTGQPPELAADLVVFLASGKADALSGCFISIDDDVTAMVSRAEEIRANELYTLRLRR
ncbi:MAG: SDR family oxidoreductase [Coriobacteriia bacterium]|nr:SDR family oxidoreductase [Coriobacteriia bacterium]